MADNNKNNGENDDDNDNESKQDISNCNCHLDQDADNDESNHMEEEATEEEEAVEAASASASASPPSSDNTGNSNINVNGNESNSVVAQQQHNFLAVLNKLSRTIVIPDATHAATAGSRNHHRGQHSHYSNHNHNNRIAMKRGAKPATAIGATASCGLEEGASSFGHAASWPSSSSPRAPSAAGSGTGTGTGADDNDNPTTSSARTLDHRQQEPAITHSDSDQASVSASSQPRAQAQTPNNAPSVVRGIATGCASTSASTSNSNSNSNCNSIPGAYYVRGRGVIVIDENDYNDDLNVSLRYSANSNLAASSISNANANTTSNNHPITTTVLSATLAPNEVPSSSSTRNPRTQQAPPQPQQQPVVVVNPTGELIVTAMAEEYPTYNSNNSCYHGSLPTDGTSSGGTFVDDPHQQSIHINHQRHCLAGWLIIAVLLVVVILLSLGLAGVLTVRNDNQPQQPKSMAQPSPPPSASAWASANSSAPSSQKIISSPTLHKIKSDGVFYCAWYQVPGFMYADLESGTLAGLNVALCLAIASAIFDRPEPVPYGLAFGNKQETAEKIFGGGGTANGTVTHPFDFDKYRELNHTFPRVEFAEFLPVEPAQVLPGLAHNMERHVKESIIKIGVSFSSPYLYQGGAISGSPHFVECAEAKGFKHTDECAGLSVCVPKGTSYYGFLMSVLPDRLIHGQSGYKNSWNAFVNGSCTLVIHDETYGVPVELLEQYNYKGDIVASNAVYNKEPIAIATFKGDPQWDDFVNAVIQSLLVAEQHNITQATAHLFPQTNVFGEDYKDMFRNAISAVGNFAELYHKYVDPFHRRALHNSINNGSAPLLSSPPLGKNLQLEDYTLGFRLQDILGRGILRCGVRSNRPGFVVQDDTDPSLLTGMDVDYCRAIASSLFGGDADSVDYILLSEDPSDGYIKLANEELDVIAGATWNLANDVREPATGLGFAFSLPYFYGYSEEEDNLCLATMQDDQDWSTFVYWIVASTIYAEERGVAQSNSNAMPIIYVFGSGLQRMFRDVIDAVGNYGEIYNSNVEEVIPRSSIPRNLLNDKSNSGPDLYPMPGFF